MTNQMIFQATLLFLLIFLCIYKFTRKHTRKVSIVVDGKVGDYQERVGNFLKQYARVTYCIPSQHQDFTLKLRGQKIVVLCRLEYRIEENQTELVKNLDNLHGESLIVFNIIQERKDLSFKEIRAQQINLEKSDQEDQIFKDNLNAFLKIQTLEIIFKAIFIVMLGLLLSCSWKPFFESVEYEPKGVNDTIEKSDYIEKMDEVVKKYENMKEQLERHINQTKIDIEEIKKQEEIKWQAEIKINEELQRNNSDLQNIINQLVNKNAELESYKKNLTVNNTEMSEQIKSIKKDLAVLSIQMNVMKESNEKLNEIIERIEKELKQNIKNETSGIVVLQDSLKKPGYFDQITNFFGLGK